MVAGDGGGGVDPDELCDGDLLDGIPALQAITAAVTPARIATATANGIDLAATDTILTDAGRTLVPEDTATAVRRWLAGIDPTAPSTTPPANPGSSGWPSPPRAASTSPGTSIRSAAKPCTPRWRR